MANIAEIGHIYVMGGVVCHGCGSIVYTASDALAAHLDACAPVREYNARRLSGEPLKTPAPPERPAPLPSPVEPGSKP